MAINLGINLGIPCGSAVGIVQESTRGKMGIRSRIQACRYRGSIAATAWATNVEVPMENQDHAGDRIGDQNMHKPSKRESTRAPDRESKWGSMTRAAPEANRGRYHDGEQIGGGSSLRGPRECIRGLSREVPTLRPCTFRSPHGLANTSPASLLRAPLLPSSCGARGIRPCGRPTFELRCSWHLTLRPTMPNGHMSYNVSPSRCSPAAKRAPWCLQQSKQRHHRSR